MLGDNSFQRGHFFIINFFNKFGDSFHFPIYFQGIFVGEFDIFLLILGINDAGLYFAVDELGDIFHVGEKAIRF